MVRGALPGFDRNRNDVGAQPAGRRCVAVTRGLEPGGRRPEHDRSRSTILDRGLHARRAELDDPDVAVLAEDRTGALEVLAGTLLERLRLDQIGNRRHGYRLPRRACSISIASNKALKLPTPKPRDPCRSMISKKN